MARKGQKQKKYSDEIIRKVINELIETGKSVSYLSKLYDIPRGTIGTWVYKYNQRGTAQRMTRGRHKSDPNQDWQEKYEILKKYLEYLEEVEQEKK